jgi:hypothetical protein
MLWVAVDVAFEHQDSAFVLFEVQGRTSVASYSEMVGGQEEMELEKVV